MRKVCSTNLLLLLLRAPSVRLRGNDVRDENQTCLPLATDTLRDPLVLSDYGQVSCTTGSDQLFYESQPAKGTSFEIYLYAPNRERASELFEEAFGEIERVETAFSNYRSSSELSRINASAADGPVITDPEVFALLARALSYSQRTDGAFDITVGKLMKAWASFAARVITPPLKSWSGRAIKLVGKV
jgi:thiamine biosynthesis lipoprotein ApbE